MRNNNNLSNTVITSQVDGVRRSVYDSVVAGLTPSKLGNLLKDAKTGKTESYLTLAEEMEERDLQYRTVLNTRKLQIVATPYIIKDIVSINKGLEKIQTFVESVTNNPQFKKMFFHLLDGLGKGFSVVEINYEYNTRDKLLHPKTYDWKPPQWFTLTESGEVLLRTGQDGQTQSIDPLKIITHKPQLKSGLPIRGGLAYAAGLIFVLKNYGIKDWASMIEVFGMPIRIGKYDSSANDSTSLEALMRAVRDIGVDYAAIIPDNMRIEFEKADISTNGDLYLKYIDYLDEQLSKLVLGQTMTTDTGSSYSQAQIHNLTREIIQAADCIDLADTINRDLIKPLVDLNFGEQEFYPFIEFDTGEKEDKQALADIAMKAHSMGIPFSVADVRNRLGLKKPDGDDDTLKQPQQLQPQNSLNSLNFEETLNFETKIENQIENEVEAELSNSNAIIEPMVNDILAVLDRCDTIEEAIEQIETANLDTTKLEKSLFESSIKAQEEARNKKQ
jgi:phage gp29-like protein